MKTFSITDVGMVRQVNQDYVFTTGKPLGILQNLFVVADGMGGHQAGDYASKCTVEVMIKEIAKSEGEDIERVLVKAIKSANREIIKEASSDEHLEVDIRSIISKVATWMICLMTFSEICFMEEVLQVAAEGHQDLPEDLEVKALNQKVLISRQVSL